MAALECKHKHCRKAITMVEVKRNGGLCDACSREKK